MSQSVNLLTQQLNSRAINAYPVQVTRRHSLLTLSSLLLAGCSSSEKPTEPAKPAEPKVSEPLTGKEAIYRMIPTVRQWSREVQLIRLNNLLLPEYKQVEGRAGGWQGVFFSPATNKTRAYRYSNQDVGTQIREGIFAGFINDWGGPTQSDMPFAPQSVVVDTNDIWKTVVEKEAAFLKQYPDLNVIYELGGSSVVPGITWQVYFGETTQKYRLRLFISPADGKVIKRELLR